MKALVSVVDPKLLNFFFFSDPDVILISDSDPGCWWKIHLNFRSADHINIPNSDFLKPLHFWIWIVDEKYIWTADNLNMLMLIFFKSVHFYNFVFVSWKQNLTWIRIRIRIQN